MFRLNTRIAAIGALLMLLMGAVPGAVGAQGGERQCFAETNQCIEGRFLQYWRANGGLPVFGYPVGPAREERNRDTGKTYLTQWFERNRFELHPEDQRPYDVLLGRLGEDNLLKQGRDWRAEYRVERPEDADCEQRTTDGKVFLLCGPIRGYYKTHGLEFDGKAGVSEAESLALFGLPLTQPKMETNSSGDTVYTQWFERARMEFHPTKPEPYKLLLALLGNEARRENPRPQPAGRPAITVVDLDGTVYEHGANGQATRLGTTPNLGKVLDAVRVGPAVAILRARGLQIVDGGVGRNITTFTEGEAVAGQLIAAGPGQPIIYNYVRRDAQAEFGVASVIGVILNGEARKVLSAEGSLRALGFTPDRRGIHVIEHGQDPSFVQIEVVATDTGRTLAWLPFAGAGVYAESPDRQTIAVVDQPRDYPDTLVFYDLNNQTGAPRNVIPHAGWNARQLIWAPNSRVVYAALYPSTDQPTGELWRVDPATRRGELVARDLPADARLLRISDDGRYLITPTMEGTFIYDLQTGSRQAIALPMESVIAR